MTSDLDNLEDKIQKAKNSDYDISNKSNTGMRTGAEFISPILGGLILGYSLDMWLNTAPFLLISLFLLGVAGGFISIYKASLDSSHETEDSRLHKSEKDAKTSAENNKQE